MQFDEKTKLNSLISFDRKLPKYCISLSPKLKKSLIHNLISTFSFPSKINLLFQ
jgi:hypothetical protein